MWMKHEQVLVRILDGRKFYQHKFVAAVEFFEHTTGIPARDDMTFVGRLPTQDLAVDLQRWREWYEDHKDLLYLDPQTGGIMPKGTKGSDQPN